MLFRSLSCGLSSLIRTSFPYYLQIHRHTTCAYKTRKTRGSVKLHVRVRAYARVYIRACARVRTRLGARARSFSRIGLSCLSFCVQVIDTAIESGKTRGVLPVVLMRLVLPLACLVGAAPAPAGGGGRRCRWWRGVGVMPMDARRTAGNGCFAAIS